MPTCRLVGASQNPDQLGNRAVGDRITEKLDDDQLACAALLTMAGPFTPMLFQGEEWAASAPFQFFTSHPEPELGKATAEGRIAEFERMGWDPAVVPDPQDPETFQRSKLDWAEVDTGRHARLLDTYRRLAALRRERIELTDPSFAHNACLVDEDTRLFEMWRGDLHVLVNFGDTAAVIELDEPAELLFETESGVDLVGTTLTVPPHAGAVVAP
jgi:maltooligosyltrehalose trehalohydrolase